MNIDIDRMLRLLGATYYLKTGLEEEQAQLKGELARLQKENEELKKGKEIEDNK